ncbi:MAG: 16S rRNA (guanine(527)-N(7))-methyltransferase RsmG [Oscillospiraceae bacterium]|nr:16S rRNA (guanine(527)-N(7))-methyltransferase RsmG [Oscillospiraceae bacterium]
MVTEILKSYIPEHAEPLSEEQYAQLERYAELLVEWNEKMNLTAITDPEGIAVKHFLDCLAFLKRAKIPEGARVADVGTGAGFPGIVLKIARPDIKLVLIDSLQKRLNFLDAVTNEIGIKAKLIHARAEDAGHDKSLRESFDFVTARAVANLAVLSEYCVPLVKVGGVFAPMKTAEVAEEIEGAKAAAKILGAEIRKPEIYEVPIAGGRSVVFMDKKAATPPKYPRQRVKISEKPLK